MAKIRFTSIKPGFVFEHEEVKLKAVSIERSNVCNGCFFRGKCNIIYPCIDGDRNNKQKHNLIFKKVEDEN